MLEIDLIRHVKVLGKPALYGSTNVAPIAAENARLLGRLLAQQKTSNAYQGVISSPLIRCQNLAREFSQLGQLSLEISPELQEMNFGSFDGVPFDDLLFEESVFEGSVVETEQEGVEKTQLHWSQLEGFFQAPANIVLPQAEALPDFHLRVKLAWKKLIEQQVSIATKQKEALILAQGQGKKESQKNKRILVIVHGGVIRMILAHILQLDWQQASWHQKLQIGHGSISRILISQPYQDKQLDQAVKQTQTKDQVQYQQLTQQVTTIAMPFLEEISDEH
ncbi:histidine phosphatase family protein [Colwellia psychrerythraea]|uniref:Phosphoglycerate mutase family protein n=1 Tax=Colwellia psychrerythraea (strain 34H / ATCC BAA-681) TaxID=167879 RepID=Q47XZ6_COLP3|nr:histidine phosphatase family protein [Colwellia psychrerythraea]AAZ24989.1 phosphoglycerate mutase family protein [Colwellia psychrerythraea 34H]